MSISFFLITFVVGLPSCFSADQLYEKCISPLKCGSGSEIFPNITYPFWGTDVDKPSYCGQSPFRLFCEDNQTLTVEKGNLTLRLVSANLKNQTIIVADESLFNSGCPKILNFKEDDRFTLNPTTVRIDLFTCSYPVQSLSTITCQETNTNMTTYHVFRSSDSTHGCEKAGDIPLLGSVNNVLQRSNGSNQSLTMALQQGFELRYNIKDKLCRDCSNSRGVCGSESRSGNFRCLCQDKPHIFSCNINDDQG